MKYNLVFFLLIFSIFLLDSCQSASFDPPSDVPNDTDLQIHPGFLGLCSQLHEEGLKQLNGMVVIEVENDAGDDLVTWGQVRTFEMDNSGNDIITIENMIVPDTGSYIVTLELGVISGQGTCFSCCNSTIVDNSNPCSPPMGGEVIFRRMSPQINSPEPPVFIDMTPVFVTCINCGC